MRPSFSRTAPARVGQRPLAFLVALLLFVPVASVAAAIPEVSSSPPALPSRSVAEVSPADSAPASGFEDSLDVELITVPFYVVDQKGDPVYDLQGSEIELWIEGERVSLDFFDRYGAAESAVLSGEVREAGEEDRLLPLSTPRHVFMLFDMAFSTPRGLEAGKRAARQLLDSLPQRDWLYLLTYHTQDGFEQALGPLAADGEGKAALAAHFGSMKPNVERIQLQADVQPIARGRREAGNVDDAYIDMHAMEKSNYRAEAYALADSLEYFSTFLRQVQGPKLVLYFTQGIDNHLYMEGLEGRFPPIRQRFDPVMQTLGETGAMLLFINGEVHTEPGVIESTTFGHEVDATFINSLPRGETSMARMAEVSGGRVLAHSNTRVLQQEILDWTSAYYEVGFYARGGFAPQPGSPPEVRVQREGVEVWSPKFIKTHREFKDLSPREKSFVVADLVLRGPAGQAAREVGESAVYRLEGNFGGQIAQDERQLTFQPQWPDDLRFKALELYSVVIEPGEGLLDGRLLFYEGYLASPATADSTMRVEVPAGGEVVWGIVAVEPISRALYVRRIMVRPEAATPPSPVKPADG